MSSSTTGWNDPRNQRPIGTGKPIFFRVKISAGTTSRTAARKTALVFQTHKLELRRHPGDVVDDLVVEEGHAALN
jgi:hypothetical protein